MADEIPKLAFSVKICENGGSGKKFSPLFHMFSQVFHRLEEEKT